ncbi:MAG: DUF4142 domain-containing protein [Gemmatimonadales bacterium]
MRVPVWRQLADSLTDGAILGLRATVDQEEIETARLAAKKAHDPRVRTFTKSLLRGHTNAQVSATELAKRWKIPLRIFADSDSAIVRRHRADMTRLRALKGALFDRVFLESVRDDHANEIAKDTSWYLPAAQNDSVKMYLREIMPTLRKHLATAEKLLDDRKIAAAH